MADIELKFVDQHADGLDPALRAFGQGADRVSSVKDFVNQVLSRVGTNDCIKKLTLIGHGSPGNIGVGSGRRVARTGNNSLGLGNIAQWEPEIRRLRCKFCRPDGEFELIGCNTGAGLAGARLLRLLVNFIRCCKATAPPEPVTPLTRSNINQIVEAIGEGEEESARLPEPIEAEHLKTVSMRAQLGPKTLFGGTDLASLTLYDASKITGVRFIPVSGLGARRTAAHEDGSSLVSAIKRSLKGAEVALAPLALYAVEGYLQLRIQLSPKRSSWLPPGALVGGCALYSPLGDDTTFLYLLRPGAQKMLARLASRSW